MKNKRNKGETVYKLIAIDLDGTLLNSKKMISLKNRENIRLAMERGVKIVVCSGRIYAGARIFARQIETKEPLVACNGAIIKDMETGEFLYSNPMNADDCLKVIDICRKYDIYFHVYIGDTMYAEKLESSALFYWEKNKQLPEDERIDVRVANNLGDVIGKTHMPVSKVVVISSNLEQLSRARRAVNCISSVDMASSNFDNFEVMNKGVSKGKAIEFLAHRFNIKREEIIAIGDNENDRSMIEYAGLGVAMGNAESFIKDMADYITLSNDQDGVAEVIRRFVL